LMIRKIIKKLESSQEFKEWKKDNKDSYISYVFKMPDEMAPDEWQIGFYNKNDTITTFMVKDTVHMMPESKIFKKPGENVLKLDINKIKIDPEKALQKAEELQQKKYETEPIIKRILLLQNLSVGQVYNITFLTRTFKTLNIKIDSKTGKIVKHELASLMEFKAS